MQPAALVAERCTLSELHTPCTIHPVNGLHDCMQFKLVSEPRLPSLRSVKRCTFKFTVAILAQGTNWADAVTQAFYCRHVRLLATMHHYGGRAHNHHGMCAMVAHVGVWHVCHPTSITWGVPTA